MIEIDGIVALDFDLACSNRLLEFENRRELDRVKINKDMMIEAIGIALGTIKPEPQQDDDENPELSEDDVL